MTDLEQGVIASPWYYGPFETMKETLHSFFTHKAVERIIPFLQAALQYGMPLGRYSLMTDGSGIDILYANVEEAKGKGMSGAILEAHEQYIDIHIALHGCETIGILPMSEQIANKKAYDSAKDIAFFHEPPQEWVEVSGSILAIIPPGICHAPLSGEGNVTKLVMKIDRGLCKAALCNISLK